jgi:MFS family permease
MHRNPLEDRNIVHLIWDIAWFGVAWVTITRFLSVYAIRVGATPTEISWLTAGPPIGMLLASIFSVWWRERYPDSIQAIFWPTLLFRFSFLMLAFTPLFPGEFQPLWLIISVTLPSLPQGISNILFVGVLKEATSDARMTPLLGRRTLVVNLTLGGAALAFGIWLEHIPYPYNYALMFAFAFVAALLSQWHLGHVQPIYVVPPRQSRSSHASPFRDVRFRVVMIHSAISYIAFFSVVPAIALRLVNELGANEGYMALYSVAELSAGAIVAVFVARIVQRFGNQMMVGFAMIATGFSVLVLAYAPTLSVALIAAALTGAGWSTSEIGLISSFTQNTTVENTARYTRTYSQIVWLSLFIAPFIGSTLAEFNIPLTQILILGAILRLGAAAYMLNIIPAISRSRHIARAGTR